MSNHLDSFATSCYPYILGVKRIDRIRNDFILEQVAQRPLSQTVRERQQRWLGHALRTNNNSITAIYALYVPQHGRRKRCRPRLLLYIKVCRTTDKFQKPGA